MARRNTIEYSYERMLKYIKNDDFLNVSYYHQINDEKFVKSLFNAYVKNDSVQRQIYKKMKI